MYVYIYIYIVNRMIPVPDMLLGMEFLRISVSSVSSTQAESIAADYFTLLRALEPTWRWQSSPLKLYWGYVTL